MRLFALCLVSLASTAVAVIDDPTQPPQQDAAVSVARPGVVPQLQSILRGEERQVAILNGRPMVVGQRGAGFVLVAIEADRVRVRLTDRGEQELVLPGINKEVQ